jgi:predicted metal-binding membrane protein
VVAWAAVGGRALFSGAPHHSIDWPQEVAEWLLMVIAMMLPLACGSLRLTALASLWCRRDRALAGFVVGFLGPWLFTGILVAAMDLQLSRLASADAIPLLTCAALGCAAIWQLGPVKRRALVNCHQLLPLAPRGWRADRDCLRFGWTIGKACLTSCCLLMLACVISGHQFWTMLCVAGIGIAERFHPRSIRQSTFSVLIGMTCIYAVVGVAGLTQPSI